MIGIEKLHPPLGAYLFDLSSVTYSGYVHVCTQIYGILNLAKHYMNVITRILYDA